MWCLTAGVNKVARHCDICATLHLYKFVTCIRGIFWPHVFIHFPLSASAAGIARCCMQTHVSLVRWCGHEFCPCNRCLHQCCFQTWSCPFSPEFVDPSGTGLIYLFLYLPNHQSPPWACLRSAPAQAWPSCRPCQQRWEVSLEVTSSTCIFSAHVCIHISSNLIFATACIWHA